MKIIWTIGLLLSGVAAFGQTSYLDKASGSGQSLKLGARAMEMISDNNLDAISGYYATKGKVDTLGLQQTAITIADEFQANEGREPTLDLKGNAPTAIYERTFYQSNEGGNVQYLLQVRISMVEENGNAFIRSIKTIKGTAIRKYDKLIKENIEEQEPVEKEPKEKRVRKASKEDEEEED